MRSPLTVMKSSPYSLQLEKVPCTGTKTQKAKNKYIFKIFKQSYDPAIPLSGLQMEEVEMYT